jgi:hypothetical protein
VVVRLVLTSESEPNPDGTVTFADPRLWLLALPDVQLEPAGFAVPQFSSVTLNVAAAPAGTEDWLTHAE